MISLVIVSQSEKIAAGVEELARQMAAMPLKIARATTDEIGIKVAIESVYSEDGVVILVDVGSGIFSAPKALELLEESQRDRVKLCAAPIVEGTIAAALQIVAGADLDRVLAEASSAMSAKIALINSEDIILAKPAIKPEIKLTVSERISLNFAVNIVNLAREFTAKITAKKANNNLAPVNLKSIDRLLYLGIEPQDEIIIAAAGEDANQALNSLQELLASKELIIGSPEIVNQNIISAIPASGGAVRGKAVFYRPLLPEISNAKAENLAKEWQDLQAALNHLKQEIETIKIANNEQIFEIYLLFLEDIAWLDRARELIFQQEYTAANAWKIIIEESLANYEKDIEPLLESIVTNSGIRILQLLGETNKTVLELAEPGIILAYDLTATEIINLNSDRVLGICLAAGSIFSETARIAEVKNIPLIVGLGEKLWQIPANSQIGIDAYIGEIFIEPNEAQLQELTLKDSLPKKLDEWGLEPTTQDSYRIPVMANIAGVTDLEYLLKLGAEGVGLYRSEYLFLDRLTPPEETEQLAVYQAIAKIIENRPFTILTLDLLRADEKNSLLGWHGIRNALDDPTLFKTQLRAILTATAAANINIMLPMVSSLSEIRAAKKIIAEVKQELTAENIKCAENIPLGILVETPAATITIDRLAAEVDFLTIDPNSLAQYIMAADRSNYRVARLADPYEPAILRSIQKVIVAARVRGLKVSICGQMASDSLAIPLLLGLGADELSLNGRIFPKIIKNISQLTLAEAEELAKEVLQLESAIAVKNRVFNSLSGLNWDF